MSYGKLVYDFLLPIFNMSVCQHYKSDFHDVDRIVFEETAVPGATYLFHVRELGTSLILLGVRKETELLQTVLQSAHPDNCELYLVTVNFDSCTIKEISAQQALLLAGARPKIEVHAARDPFGKSPTVYQFNRGDTIVGSASISPAYQPGTANLRIDVSASIPSSTDRLTQMHVSQLIHHACTKETQTLFWRYGEHLINEMPAVLWCKQLTARSLSTTPKSTL